VDMTRICRIWMLVILLVFVPLDVGLKFTVSNQYRQVPASQVVKLVDTNAVRSATLTVPTQVIQVTTKDGRNLEATWVGNQDNQITRALQSNGTSYDVKNPQGNSLLNVLLGWLPFIVIFLLFFVFMNQMQGGGSRVMNFGKSKAKLITKDTPKTTFADVAGADEAIEELQEIKDFLQSPGKFQAVGAKIPKGVLLYGPPGPRHTLLARAVAGEAGVPFYSISGSDFVEMFVGVGASRVRDLFEQAKANAPAIVFVDEIDAVGRHRGAGFGGGHDEREQTLNQLLVELDGFDTKGGVIVIAATNRPDVDLALIARRTPGFTGADLANVINEGALLTARANQTQIQMASLEEAIDRVTAGPKRKSVLLSEKERKIIAYHEGGHALVGHALPHADPGHTITIIPRGRALGYTASAPAADKFLVSRAEVVDQLAMLLGGPTAEE